MAFTGSSQRLEYEENKEEIDSVVCHDTRSVGKDLPGLGVRSRPVPKETGMVRYS